jgi:hypothetical protein
MGMGQRLGGVRNNKVREQGDSLIRTIEPRIIEELALEPGEKPDTIEADGDERRLVLEFPQE